MSYAAESLRWYSKDGQPVPTVKGKNGKDRAPTIRDARELGLLPSVSSICRSAAAPGLEAWKRRNLVLACLTLPRLPEEPLEAFIDRVAEDAAKEGEQAAERGKAIHTAVQRHAQGQTVDPQYLAHIAALELALEGFGIKLTKGVAERSFAAGTFSGTPDWFDDRNCMDFKTKETIEPDLKAWDNHLVQLAGYDIGLSYPEHDALAPRRLLSVFIGAKDAKVHIHPWTLEDSLRGREMFNGLLRYTLSRDRL